MKKSELEAQVASLQDELRRSLEREFDALSDVATLRDRESRWTEEGIEAVAKMQAAQREVATLRARLSRAEQIEEAAHAYMRSLETDCLQAAIDLRALKDALKEATP